MSDSIAGASLRSMSDFLSRYCGRKDVYNPLSIVNYLQEKRVGVYGRTFRYGAGGIKANREERLPGGAYGKRDSQGAYQKVRICVLWKESVDRQLKKSLGN